MIFTCQIQVALMSISYWLLPKGNLCLTRMHSSWMRTARSLTVSRRIVCTPPLEKPCMPPPEQPRMPPRATMHPPWSNHAHPPPPEQPCMPPRATMHAPPGSNHALPPGATTHVPPLEQPRMPPPCCGQTDTCKNNLRKLRLRAVKTN